MLAQVEGVGQAGRGALVDSRSHPFDDRFFGTNKSFGDLMSAEYDRVIDLCTLLSLHGFFVLLSVAVSGIANLFIGWW